jgi:hypothetical protein
MAAASYYHNVPHSSSQLDLANMSRVSMSSPNLRPQGGNTSPPKSPLKPMFLAQAHPTSPGYQNLGYQDDLDLIQKADEVCLSPTSSSPHLKIMNANRNCPNSNSNAKSVPFAS